MKPEVHLLTSSQGPAKEPHPEPVEISNLSHARSLYKSLYCYPPIEAHVSSQVTSIQFSELKLSMPIFVIHLHLVLHFYLIIQSTKPTNL